MQATAASRVLAAIEATAANVRDQHVMQTYTTKQTHYNDQQQPQRIITINNTNVTH